MLILRYISLVLNLNYVLMQYHQSDYDIKLERLEAPRYNHSFYRDLHAGLAWYNRSQRVINASAYILQNMTSDIKVDIQVYKFFSNEYRFFPITFSDYVCSSLNRNLFGTRDMQDKYSNFAHCPCKAGFYYLRNAVVDFSTLPPFIPAGQYKLTAIASYKSEFILELHFYGIVTTFIKKWES